MPSSAIAQCAAGNHGAVPFGPAVTLADSGRMYSYLVSPDGREFYFFRRVGAQPEDYRIYRSLRAGSGWSAPQQLVLGGEYSDLYPSLSPDGQRLVFSSYRPAPGDTSTKPNAHIWMSQRVGDTWSSPRYVGASQLGHYHSGLRQDSNGTLRLRLTTPDWSSARDVELRWIGNDFASTFTEAPELAAVSHFRSISGDSIYIWGGLQGAQGLTLLSVSRVTQPRNRRSPAHYFVTYARNNAFTPLIPAGGGLAQGSPNFAWFSPDGCYLHYTRDYSEFMRVPVSALVRGGSTP